MIVFLSLCNYRVYRCTRLDFLNGSWAVCTSRVIGLKIKNKFKKFTFAQSCGGRQKKKTRFIYKMQRYFLCFFCTSKLIQISFFEEKKGFRYFIIWVQYIFLKLHCRILKLLLSVYHADLLSFTAVKFLDECYQYMYEHHNFVLFNSNLILFIFLEKYFRFIVWIYAPLCFNYNSLHLFLQNS